MYSFTIGHACFLFCRDIQATFQNTFMKAYSYDKDAQLACFGEGEITVKS